MKKSYTIQALSMTFLLVFFTLRVFSQNAWFNEFHYDNSGTDVGEFLEIVIENPGDYDLSQFTVTLYNGNGGASYASNTVDNFLTTTTVGNYTIYYWDVVIQNGSPDGFSLDYQGNVLQFLSYEGSFVATNGPANGMISTDIGVSEGSSTPEGYSLQLQGTGATYADFTWAGPIENTEGLVNTGQTIYRIPETPISNWAILIGVLLITMFAYFRFRKAA